MKCILLLFCLWSVCVNGFINVYPKLKSKKINGDPGKPLFLTPLIESGQIDQARNASQVSFNGFKNINSYSGYLTVNKQYNSNLFFWFFPAKTDYANAPVVLWLQGGPGATSLFGLFMENGPFSVKQKHGLRLRKYTWIENHSVIYIDNPVGTGYSFTDSDKGYARTETNVGADLYTALLQFFQIFPELQKNKFFVTGESYAGKYVPALSYTIHRNNPTAKQKINLQGLAIGNGLSDPINQLKYGDYLYQLGLLDSNGRDYFYQMETSCTNSIKKQDWKAAFNCFDSLLNGDLTKGSYFKNVTGFENYFNYLHNKNYGNTDAFSTYIQRADIRAAIHVGNQTFNVETTTVEKNLVMDVMQSVAPWISVLLSYYPVLIYNGQLDIIVAYPLTINYLKNLKFNGANEYKTAQRHIWYVGDDLAGYVKVAGKLTEVMVRNAGHMVPADQPQWAQDLITRFTNNKPFF